MGDSKWSNLIKSQKFPENFSKLFIVVKTYLFNQYLILSSASKEQISKEKIKWQR